MTDRYLPAGIWREPQVNPLRFVVRYDSKPNDNFDELEPLEPTRQMAIQLPAGPVTHFFPDFVKLSKRAYRRQRGKIKGQRAAIRAGGA